MPKCMLLPAVSILCLALVGCGGSGPTDPADPADRSVELVSQQAKGGNGGGATPRIFDVSVTGSISGSVSGHVQNVKPTDHRLGVPNFPMDITYLQTAVPNGAICFADSQIDPSESLEFRISTPKQASSEVGAQFWFDGVSTTGENVLYRLVMDGDFVSGEQTWIGDAVISYFSFSINGALEGSKGGKNRQNICQGGGAIAVTVTVDEVG